MSTNLHSVFSLYYNKNDILTNFSCKYHELIYIVSGCVEIEIDDVLHNCTSNSVCFIKAGISRNQICHEQAQYICIRFNKTHDLSVQSGVFNLNSDTTFMLFKQLQNEYKNKDYLYFDICNLKTDEILLNLLRQTKKEEKSGSDILKLIKEIDETLLFDKTISEMAESLNYNYDYFRHKFKLITGKSPINYIVDKRIEHACELLKKNLYTCTEIAHLCGFASSSQFSKLFKRHMGISPNVYQKKTN